MDFEALAVAVDDQAARPAAERRSGTLYGVRAVPGPDGTGAIELEVLGRGEGREIPVRVRPPGGLAAIALCCGAWAAPVEEDGTMPCRPGRHPQRRRVHLTVVVGGDDGEEEVSVLRYGDEEPQVLRGGVGLVSDRLARCWARRRE